MKFEYLQFSFAIICVIGESAQIIRQYMSQNTNIHQNN